MPAAALEGASKYLNNLLLARGFLQDGIPIDFADLADEDNDEAAEHERKSDKHATTTRVINLVHDLVLRRDRDAEQREALGAMMRELRREESQRLLDLQRLQDKNARLKSELSTAEAHQRTLSIAAKKAQAETKELKEQALKMKSTLDQVRAKCISDVRKRDVELDKLKSHLSNLNRRKKESMAGGMKINTLNIHQKSNASHGRPSHENNSGDWTLENETNDFLAAVVNETSAENVALRKIVGDSMKFLHNLTGLDEDERGPPKPADLADPKAAIGIPGQYRDRDASLSVQSDSLTPVQSLASSMSAVLLHCQTLLRDPSFVPIEEVEIRDAQIEKLTAGWEKMADRWKEAVTMMSQWRQKMLTDHEQSHISVEDVQSHFDAERLSGITGFGRSMAMRPNGQPVLDPIEEEELTSMLMDHHSKVGNHSTLSNALNEHTKNSNIRHEDSLPEPDETGTPKQPPLHIHADDEVESDLKLATQEPPKPMASPARRGVKLQLPAPDNQPLSNPNANPKKRKPDTTSASPRKRRSISPGAARTTHHEAAPKTTDSLNRSTESTDPLHFETLTPDLSADDAEDDIFTTDVASKDAKIPRMTVAQKLAVVEAEATEATEVIRMRQATTRSDARSGGDPRSEG